MQSKGPDSPFPTDEGRGAAVPVR